MPLASSACLPVGMKLLLIAAALAVAGCASISLEDLEFHAWKLKYGESTFLFAKYRRCDGFHKHLVYVSTLIGVLCSVLAPLNLRKVLQLSVRGSQPQANLAQQPKTGAGAQHHGRSGH